MSILDQASEFFHRLQDQITEGLEFLERSEDVADSLKKRNPAAFHQDLWSHKESSGLITDGGGRTRILSEGRIIEKGGVNVSDVSGRFPADFSSTMPGTGRNFRAAGISLVLHPYSPQIPTVHANFRFIARFHDDGSPDCFWFGGGADLTPYILYEEDAVHFHKTWKNACDLHPDVANYDKFKSHCDEYFYLKHRQECRGIGGIFYDYLKEDSFESPRAAELLAFTKTAGSSFLDAYLPVAKKRSLEPFTEQQKNFQLIRRGRYVEFNLVYDRGTVFGLKTGGRIESILMSLPLHVSWVYDYQPAGGQESGLIEVLKKPRNWL